MSRETFGQAIVRLRTEKQISQARLARAVRVDQGSLSRYERDKRKPDRDIAALLDHELEAGGALLELWVPSASDLLNPDEKDRVVHNLEHPSRLDSGTVDALAKVLAAQRRLDDSLGPEAIMGATMSQLSLVESLLRDVRGPHRDLLAEVVAESVQFAGWLYAETRRDRDAVRLLGRAEELADELENGTLVAQALNFRGYLARQQQKPARVARLFHSAHSTPGAHPAQRIGDAAQAAQGYANLGDINEAHRLLGVATELMDSAGADQPPGTAYWLLPKFHHLNIGLAYAAIGDQANAADHLRDGLAALPVDQQGAMWVVEYQQAYEVAEQAR